MVLISQARPRHSIRTADGGTEPFLLSNSNGNAHMYDSIHCDFSVVCIFFVSHNIPLNDRYTHFCNGLIRLFSRCRCHTKLLLSLPLLLHALHICCWTENAIRFRPIAKCRGRLVFMRIAFHTRPVPNAQTMARFSYANTGDDNSIVVYVSRPPQCIYHSIDSFRIVSDMFGAIFTGFICS